jgi:hypothetical protein
MRAIEGNRKKKNLAKKKYCQLVQIKKASYESWLSPQIIIDYYKSITTVLNIFRLQAAQI